MIISKKLQLLIKILGLTQEKLAKELEVFFVTINSWINKRSVPRKNKQELIDKQIKDCIIHKIKLYI